MLAVHGVSGWKCIFCSSHLGDVIVVAGLLAPTPAQDALRFVLRLWVRTTATAVQNRNLGELRLWTIVPIRTVFGTMAVLVGSVVAVAELRNFTGVLIGTWYILGDFLWSASNDKWIGVDVMNKRTRAIDEDTYKLIIATMKNGFAHEGVQYKPNERIAIVLVLEYNLGLRVGDILNLCIDSFVKDGSRYRLDIYE